MNYPLIGLFLLVGLLLASFLHLARSSNKKYHILRLYHEAVDNAKSAKTLQDIKSSLIQWSDTELQSCLYGKHLKEACRILQYIDRRMYQLTGANHE